MSTMPLPQQFTLPPIGVTVREDGQIQVEWQPHAQSAGPAALRLPAAVQEALAAGVLAGADDSTVLAQAGVAASPPVLAVLAEYRAHPLARLAREQRRAADEKLLKLQSHARIDAQLARLHPARQQVERVAGLEAERFHRDFYAANRPVVMTGQMQHWPAMSRWTPDYLKARFGEVPVQVQMGRESDPDFEVNMHLLRHTMPFGDYVQKVETSPPSNDFYMVASNHVLHETGLGALMEDVDFFPELMSPERLPGSTFFWYGPAGTVTPLHHDPSNIILAQLRGRKHVRMYPPVQTPLLDNCLGVYSGADPENPTAGPPEFVHATAMETTLGPGEALFIPVGWWHHVRSLDVAISVSSTAFRADNFFEWNMPNHPARPRRTTAARY